MFKCFLCVLSLWKLAEEQGGSWRSGLGVVKIKKYADAMVVLSFLLFFMFEHSKHDGTFNLYSDPHNQLEICKRRIGGIIFFLIPGWEGLLFVVDLWFGIDIQKYSIKRLLLYLRSKGEIGKFSPIPTSEYCFKLCIDEGQDLLFALSQREEQERTELVQRKWKGRQWNKLLKRVRAGNGCYSR